MEVVGSLCTLLMTIIPCLGSLLSSSYLPCIPWLFGLFFSQYCLIPYCMGLCLIFPSMCPCCFPLCACSSPLLILGAGGLICTMCLTDMLSSILGCCGILQGLDIEILQCESLFRTFPIERVSTWISKSGGCLICLFGTWWMKGIKRW